MLSLDTPALIKGRGDLDVALWSQRIKDVPQLKMSGHRLRPLVEQSEQIQMTRHNASHVSSKISIRELGETSRGHCHISTTCSCDAWRGQWKTPWIKMTVHYMLSLNCDSRSWICFLRDLPSIHLASLFKQNNSFSRFNKLLEMKRACYT